MRIVRGRNELPVSLRQFPENHRLDYDHEYIIECSHSEQKYCLEVSGASYPQTAHVFSLIRFCCMDLEGARPMVSGLTKRPLWFGPSYVTGWPV